MPINNRQHLIVTVIKILVQYLTSFIMFNQEEEPKLKYERLSNDIVDILKKDCISCLAVHSKVHIAIKSTSLNKYETYDKV